MNININISKKIVSRNTLLIAIFTMFNLTGDVTNKLSLKLESEFVIVVNDVQNGTHQPSFSKLCATNKKCSITHATLKPEPEPSTKKNQSIKTILRP
ncbi:hypothetical protein [Alteromonas sp. 14N.309.X.WAT.G.H12]|uniref:hypothetical protein n=1 Tax=Alteromonas sp. 14N.309.X.WAT.G.H12 TaxID=3120824 RepID=UPI002FD761D6